MSSFSSATNNQCHNSSTTTITNNNKNDSTQQHTFKDTKMCQSERRLSMGSETDEECNSSVQDTVTSITSSSKRTLEDDPKLGHVKVEERSVDPQEDSLHDNVVNHDDGDVHYYEGTYDHGSANDDDDGGDDKKNKKDSKPKKTKRHGHHRSLSGLFSENAFISESGKMTSPPLSTNDNNNTMAKSAAASTYPSQQLRSSTTTSTSSYTQLEESRYSNNQSDENDSSSINSRKHRRMYSGGVSNPSMAHRRINSRGNAAFINRNTIMEIMKQSDTVGGVEPPATAAAAAEAYFPYQQQQQNQHPSSLNFGRSSRSLSPTPSPKFFSSYEMIGGRHSTDDSDIHKYFSQHPPGGSNKHEKKTNEYNMMVNNAGIQRRQSDDSVPKVTDNTLDSTNPTTSTGGIVEGDEKIAAAHWLQHIRKSPPLDFAAMEYVEHFPPAIQQPLPNDNYGMNSYHSSEAYPSSRHSFPPTSKQFSKKFSRNSSVAGSRVGSPHPFYDSNGTLSEFNYSPFEGSLSSLPINDFNFRQSSTASSVGSLPPHPYHLKHYPSQQLQSHGSDSRNYNNGAPSQYHLSNKHSPPQDHPFYSTSSSTYPVQQRNRHPHHYNQQITNRHQYDRSSYIAATNAAKDAAMGLPPHPLAMEKGPNQRRHHRPTSSIETKIETDELLFQKSAPAVRKGAPKRQDVPHYRISPQLFEDSLKEYSNNEGSESPPTSLHYSNSYQESLLSSLVDPSCSVSSQSSQWQKPQNQDYNEKGHHQRNSSMGILHSLVQDIDKLPPAQKKASHQRVSSTGTLVLDDSLFDEKIMEPIQPIVSNEIVHQSLSNRSERLKKPAQMNTRASTKSSQKQDLSQHQDIKSSATQSPQDNGHSKPATGRKISGGVSKRVRRKCSFVGCTNRVVQGGLCIAHGAKRKKCGFNGCSKHVKKAGMCSTHGPARKRCELEGCPKVAVQGGKCIAHGAKKKLCKVDECQKQAILSGMCKKHHDLEKSGKLQLPSTVSEGEYCQPVGYNSSMFTKENEGNSPDSDAAAQITTKTASHRRGLSIFQDMSAVNTLIGSTSRVTTTDQAVDGRERASSSTRARSSSRANRRSSHNRGLSIFTDEEVINNIVHNGI